MSVSPVQLDFFRTHGYLPLPRLFSPRHVAALRGRLEERCSGAAAEELALSRISDIAREDALFYAHARSGELLEVVERVLGVPLALYTDEALLKPPCAKGEETERQDNARFRVRPAAHLLTCWTALDDMDAASGSLHYYPGSHQRGLLPPEELGSLDRRASVPVPIEAGGCVLHHALAVHWSPPNLSARPIRAFACFYVRSDAAVGEREPNSPPLLEVRA